MEHKGQRFLLQDGKLHPVPEFPESFGVELQRALEDVASGVAPAGPSCETRATSAFFAAFLPLFPTILASLPSIACFGLFISPILAVSLVSLQPCLLPLIQLDAT